MQFHLKTAQTVVIGVVLALGLMLSAVAPARADLILSTMPTNPGSINNIFGAGTNVMTAIDVGAANVSITSFGTYGFLPSSGNLKWAIFNSTATAPVFSSSVVAATAASDRMWYDSPTFSPFTLQANQRYYLGLISQKSFVYSSDSPGISVTQGGLTAPSGVNGYGSGTFANPQHNGNGSSLLSFRAFGTNAAVVGTPEPETWAMMGLGLLALGVFQWRRKKYAPVSAYSVSQMR